MYIHDSVKKRQLLIMKKIIFLFCFIAYYFIGSSQIQNYAIGQVVDNFAVTDIDGTEHNLYNYTSQGKHVFVNFFVVNSTACRVTLPHFNQLYDHYGCNTEDMICISINGGIDNDLDVSAFSSAHGGLYLHAPMVGTNGGAADVNSNFNPEGYPTFCIIGPDNKLLNANIWPALSLANFQSAFPVGFSPEVNPCTVSTSDLKGESDKPVVYPNPVSSELHVLYSTSNLKTVSLDIFNIKGDTIATHNRASFTEELVIPVHELNEGIYIANIKSDDGKNDVIQFVVIR